MKKTLLKVVTFTIIIGILAISFNYAFGNHTITYLDKLQINMANNQHFYIWKFNYFPYLKNIELSVTDLSILQFDMPTRQWSNNWNLTDWPATLGNNLALILDYVIMVINILLYPIKIGAYLLRNILAIFGINTDTNDNLNGLAWLTIFINNILSNFSIPYI